VQRAVRLGDGAGNAAVENGRRVVLERLGRAVQAGWLVDVDRSVGEVGDQFRDRRRRRRGVTTRHDEDGQVTFAAQVRARHPGGVPAEGGRHPQARPARGGQLPGEPGRVLLPGRAEDTGGERVLAGSADAHAHVGQIGVKA
jgi:hypothetical protein